MIRAKHLLNDVTRCFGNYMAADGRYQHCPRRMTCARYMDRDIYDAHTTFSTANCESSPVHGEYPNYIPVRIIGGGANE